MHEHNPVLFVSKQQPVFSLSKMKQNDVVVVVQAFSPSTQEMEARESWDFEGSLVYVAGSWAARDT